MIGQEPPLERVQHMTSDPENAQDNLRGRQLAVYEALLEVDGELAAIYAGR